jgi:GGDEF domain-containing protein
VSQIVEPASRVWTEFRPRFGLVVASVLSAGVLIGIEDGLSRVVLGILVVAAVMVSLARDGYAGVVVGLAGAAVLVLVKRLTGDLTPREFFVVGAEVASVVTVSWLVGILGHHLRTSVERVMRPTAGSVLPTANAMGVLGPEIGLHRLDEELNRRQASGGPLALALVAHHPMADADDEALEPARRAIARHVESVLGDSDVVFALDDDTLAVILPTADWTTGLSTLGRVALAASQATYAAPEDRSRRSVSDTTRISTALVFADDATADSRGLVSKAQDALLSGRGADR